MIISGHFFTSGSEEHRQILLPTVLQAQNVSTVQRHMGLNSIKSIKYCLISLNWKSIISSENLNNREGQTDSTTVDQYVCKKKRL